MARCPESVLGWIPWYGEPVEGSESALTLEQRGAVEAHAAECSECRAEIDMIAGAPFEIDVELPDSDRVFEEITARIDAGEDESADPASLSPVIPIGRRSQLEEGEYRRLADWIFDESSEAELLSETETEPETESLESEAPGAGRGADAGAGRGVVVEGPWSRSPAWAAAAAILLLSVGGLLGGLGGRFLSDADGLANERIAQSPTTAVYELASAPSASTIATPDAPLSPSARPKIDVVFVDTASVGEISAALRSVGVEIVSGPSTMGVYRLQLTEASSAGGAPSASDAAAIAARFKAQAAPIVILAEPVR